MAWSRRATRGLRGHVDCLELLLTMPRPSSLRDVSFHDGYTPLHAAVIARSIECVRLLLGHGFNPSAQNKFLQTALHIAASLEVRAGCTAPVKAAEMLLAAGCDASLKDERGHDAAHVAKRKGQEHIVSLIAAAEPQKAVTSLSAENQPNRGGRDSGGWDEVAAGVAAVATARCIGRMLVAKKRWGRTRQLRLRSFSPFPEPGTVDAGWMVHSTCGTARPLTVYSHGAALPCENAWRTRSNRHCSISSRDCLSLNSGARRMQSVADPASSSSELLLRVQVEYQEEARGVGLASLLRPCIVAWTIFRSFLLSSSAAYEICIP